MSAKTMPLAALALCFSLLGAACAVGTDSELGENVGETAQAVGEFCGGIAGFQCSEGLVCVDAPHDGCDPANGGADCGGVCVAPKKAKHPKCGDKNRSYVGESPAECQLVRFACPEGTEMFSDKCGCGCVTL